MSAAAAARSALPLTFVTGNANKLKEVKQMLGAHVPTLTNIKLDLPELQGEPEEVSREKCRLASKEVNGPVIGTCVLRLLCSLDRFPPPRPFFHD
jgi:inosine triphosphate pyrophosphatase